MENNCVFMDWKDWYCWNSHATQGNIQIQWNPFQNTNGIFLRTRISNSKMYVEPQKTPNCQSNLKKTKNKSGGITLADIRLNCKVIVIK